MKRRVSVRNVAWTLGLIICGFVLLGVLGDVLRVTSGIGRDHLLVRRFSLDMERAIPTWYSVFGLAWSAVLLAGIGFSLRQWRGWQVVGWMGLAVIFVFLAMDEGLAFHERLIEPMRRLLDPPPLFHFAWVIPYMAAVVVIGVAYLKFLWGLDRRTRWTLICAGFVFVSGAVGMELVGGYLHFVDGARRTPAYAAVSSVEELLEMAGIAIFICGLLFFQAPSATRATVPLYRLGVTISIALVATLATWGVHHTRTAASYEYRFAGRLLAGTGGEQDPAGAARLYRKSAERDFAPAQFALGRMLLRGTEIAADHEQASIWLLRSATQGMVAAQISIGNMYVSGTGVARDPVAARHWFKRAADQGNVTGYFNLAIHYFDGRDTPRDIDRAFGYFMQAAQRGMPAAQSYIGGFYEAGYLNSGGLETALRWYEFSALNGYAAAGRAAARVRTKLAD